MPSEFITERKEVTEIKCDHVNSIYKGINTLYLQKADYNKLFNSLDNFKNRKQLLQELGFPLKLGILLHGLPGTGKSATILAIASYLQKDLFFVDLRTVKTNKDLKMIFDHILTINLNGGILVFEDIDCATKTVLKRDTEEEKNTTSILSDEDSEFTLDYFLNVLQGTLTRDNTIFIMTTNYVNKLDSALIRDGRIDVNIEMKLTNNEQLCQMWKTIFKREVKQEVLEKFQEHTHKPATILSRLAQYLTCGEEIEDELILQPFLDFLQVAKKENEDQLLRENLIQSINNKISSESSIRVKDYFN
jgi:chaperone BCS1